jgi:hypothetical protein
MAPLLSQDDLRDALNYWALGYGTADITVILNRPSRHDAVTEAAVANSIGRFHGFTQGRAA